MACWKNYKPEDIFNKLENIDDVIPIKGRESKRSLFNKEKSKEIAESQNNRLPQIKTSKKGNNLTSREQSTDEEAILVNDSKKLHIPGVNLLKNSPQRSIKGDI